MELNKTLRFLFEKMFTYVNAEIEGFDFSEDEWYLKYEWSKEDELSFAEWLRDEIKTNNEVRKLFGLPYRPYSRRVVDTVSAFIGNYGWKTKKPL